eukprot:354767-Chlamydomonas_euryale.AAC.7
MDQTGSTRSLGWAGGSRRRWVGLSGQRAGEGGAPWPNDQREERGRRVGDRAQGCRVRRRVSRISPWSTNCHFSATTAICFKHINNTENFLGSIGPRSRQPRLLSTASRQPPVLAVILSRPGQTSRLHRSGPPPTRIPPR